MNRLQVDFDATRQTKQQLELKCKELKEAEKKDKDRLAEERKTKKAEKLKDGNKCRMDQHFFCCFAFCN